MILITGGLGYIVSHTVVELIAQGKEVLIVDDLSNANLQVLEGLEKITGQSISFVQLDVKEASPLNELIKTYPQLEGVIHFAAAKAVGESALNPLKYYQNNVGGLLNLLQSIPTNIPFIFSSSCTVYGDADTLPIVENSPIKRPKSPYGNTKKIGEEILEEYSRAHANFKAISLRYFNPIGAHASGYIGENPKGKPENLVPYITQSAVGENSPLTVFGDDYPTADGTCVRDYIHVVDLARAHVVAFNRLEENKSKTAYEVFNVGTGQGHSVLEVIASFERVSGKNLNYSIGPRREGDIVAAYANVDKALQQLNWSPKYSLDEAIHSAWQWELNNSSR